MRKLAILLAILCAFLLGYALRAQTPAPYQFSVNASTTMANCTMVASQTTYCFAGDGVYKSINGATFVPIGPVLSVNGQTGVVVLAIPSKATLPAQTLALQ